MNDSATPSADQKASPRVECPSAGEPYIRLFLAAGVAVVLGIWCFLDRGNYKPPPDGDPLGYYFNHYALYVLAPLGVLFALWGLRVRKRLLVADEDGIGYAGKPAVPWSRVVALDASQLKDKQVLRLRLASGGALKLDGWKLKNFKELVAFIEQKVPAPPGQTDSPSAESDEDTGRDPPQA